jgi:hypothetical protein
MRVAIALLAVTTGCAAAVRNGMVSGPYYDACMKRIGLSEGEDRWDEADEVCRQQARAKAQDAMSPDGETVCRNVFGTLRCEHYDYTK